jgi:hypothetical protein
LSSISLLNPERVTVSKCLSIWQVPLHPVPAQKKIKGQNKMKITSLRQHADSKREEL